MELLYFEAETDDSGRFTLRDVPVGGYAASVSERHLVVQPYDVEVLAGAGTPPLELAGRVRYRLDVRLVGEIDAPDDTVVRIHVRREVRDHGNSFAGPERRAEFTLDEPGTYHISVWFGGRTFEAVPATVEVVEPDTVIEIRPGRQVESDR